MMPRDMCIAELARRRHERMIIVAAYHAAFDLMRVSPHPLNFVSIGAMGLGYSHALGLALGRPDMQVVVLDGDGSLLMNLGTLVTIGEAAPPNLVHCVCENGIYEANGGVPVPGRGKVDFAAIALAAGYRDATVFNELEDFAQRLPQLLAATGPVFATLRIVPGAASKKDYATIHGPQPRSAFRAALRAR